MYINLILVEVEVEMEVEGGRKLLVRCCYFCCHHQSFSIGVNSMMNAIIFVYPQGIWLSLVRSQAKKLLFSGWFWLDSTIGERKSK